MALNKLNELTLLNWNCNGIEKQFDYLSHFIRSNKIDIACITETHLRPSSKCNLKIPGYVSYRNDRICDKATGGVAIIIHRRIAHCCLNTPSSEKLETIGIKLTQSYQQDVHIIAAYRPPNKPFPTDILKQILFLKNPIIISGELNAKHKTWGCNVTTLQGKKLLQIATEKACAINALTAPTFYPAHINVKPDILDLTLTKNIKLPIIQRPQPELNSDHSPVIITFNINKTPVTQRQRIITGKINWQKFREQLSHQLSVPRNLTNNTRIEIEIENFTSAIHSAIKNSQTPVAKFNFQNCQIPNKILKMIATKRQLRRKWQRLRLPHFKNQINNLGHQINQALEKNRFKFFQKTISQISPASKDQWTTIRHLTKEKTYIPVLKLKNSEAITDCEKARAFAKYFSSTFTLNNAHDTEFTAKVENEINEKWYTAELPIKFISPKEITNQIKRLPPKTSSGHDQIPNCVIKELPHQAISVLTAIFNACFRLGYFPQQ